MAYRTKTYIAADWDGDKAAIDKPSGMTVKNGIYHLPMFTRQHNQAMTA